MQFCGINVSDEEDGRGNNVLVLVPNDDFAVAMQIFGPDVR